MRIIGIDPGLNCTGIAYNAEDPNVDPIVKYVRPQQRGIRDKAREIMREIPDVCFDLLVIEVPQVYQGSRQKGDPNDLIRLSLLAGNLEALISTYNVIEVLPATWKGQVPKPLHHARLRDRVGFRGKMPHDALDALGIMLYGEDVVAAQLMARRNKKPL